MDPRKIAGALLVAAVLGILCFFGFAFDSLPDGTDVVRLSGDAANACRAFDERIVPNGTGMVAVVRKVGCAWGFGNTDHYYVVFVRGEHQIDDREHIALEYDLKGETATPSLSVAWHGNTVLSVRVRGRVDRLIRQRGHLDGIALKSEFDPEPDVTEFAAVKP